MKIALGRGDELDIELPCGKRIALEVAEEAEHDGQFSLCAWEYDCELEIIDATSGLFQVVRDDNTPSGG